MGATVSLSVSGTSSNVELGWASVSPLPPPPTAVQVCNTGSNIAYVTLGATNAVTAATTNYPIYPEVNSVPSCVVLAMNGASYLAGITASSTTTLIITTGNGSPQASYAKPKSFVSGSYAIATGTSTTDVLATGTSLTDVLAAQ